MPSGARLSSLPMGSVRLSDGFWTAWQGAMAATGLAHQWRQCEETGRIENLRRCGRGEVGGSQGLRFNDSDVYKLIEACAYALALDPGCSIRAQVESAVEIICAAQMADGYLNSHIQLVHPGKQWKSLCAMHEMYGAGHLVEAGVALYEATGDSRLLDVGRRFADHIMSVFGPSGRFGYPGHQELEIALVRLSSSTGEGKYGEYASWLVRSRGSKPSPFEAELADHEACAMSPGVRALFIKDGEYDGAYAQDDVPLVEQSRAVGHAVRAMYFYCGALDCMGGDDALMRALSRIWDGLVSGQMYVTGGIGSSEHNEGFTTEYDLPNLEAYAETCAAVGLVMWAWRMHLASGEARYVDVLERALFNSVLSGVSFSCDRYFYENPLESDGRHSRKAWYACACCPPNVARLVLSVGRMAVCSGDGEISVAMPLAGTYSAGPATVEIESEYPWSGGFVVRLSEVSGLKRLLLRVPEWAEEALVDGEPHGPGTVELSRDWKDGDTIVVQLLMKARWERSHPSVLGNAGRVALLRGPLVYCLEEHDLGSAPHLWAADTGAAVREIAGSDPRQTVDLEVDGTLDALLGEGLYRDASRLGREPKAARFVPYFTWANRGANCMQVWVRHVGLGTAMPDV